MTFEKIEDANSAYDALTEDFNKQKKELEEEKLKTAAYEEQMKKERAEHAAAKEELEKVKKMNYQLASRLDTGKPTKSDTDLIAELAGWKK